MQEWVRKEGAEFHSAERKGYSIGNDFAGTIDQVLSIGGGVVGVADIKTGSSVAGWSGRWAGRVHDNIQLQLASYVGMLAEEGIIEDPHTAPRIVLHIPVRGSVRLKAYNLADPNAKEYTCWEDDYAAFCGLRKTHRVMRGF